ncbi:SRPBCC family protein [Mitsuaria sp. GD03876]|uniref:SRPBCC family protein n=1 Tax=Mitsuaria sp. GD03876 TaxID=2975399 RepID=UPI00244BDDB9|nr:SRPBCC family protein [Mitsuaria sp. GD03876]MDH0865439.1 SRPBCC family protein [Mitsuaria sp. GD03876]
MTPIPTMHTSFVIERTFRASPAAVFRAWADPEAKRQWSDCHPENVVHYSLDFRPLGRESYHARHTEFGEQVVEKVFFDIVDDRRIVFAYDMAIGGRKLSASLVTVEFEAVDAGARMVYTEQLAYFDGHRDVEQRIQGTEDGLGRLGLMVETGPGLAQ